MDYYNPFEEEKDLDPLKDNSRETGFVDHFWDLDMIETSELDELLGEGED